MQGANLSEEASIVREFFAKLSSLGLLSLNNPRRVKSVLPFEAMGDVVANWCAVPLQSISEIETETVTKTED